VACIQTLKNAKGVITDSGGITEETTVFHTPCITLRTTTERLETCEIGTNILIGEDLQMLEKSIKDIINGQWKKGSILELWDGKTAEGIGEFFLSIQV
jgi:UDP-N-acetylglucosamine 2-epimerase (non-hydrolysing)